MSPEARAIIKLRSELARDLGSAKGHLELLRRHAAQLTANADEVVASFVALSLHHHYTAIEQACERIARVFDGRAPGGASGHRELLDAMTLALPALRPAVFSEATAEVLRELLGFRHFVRHAYAVAWRVERLVALIAVAEAAWPAVARDLAGFDAFLATLAV